MTGAGIWSSAAVDSGGDVYVTTGNSGKGPVEPGHSDSIIKLSGYTLKPVQSFQVPPAQAVADGDFGASPTVFGPYVGACNKNGIFYALSRTTMDAGLVAPDRCPAPRGMASATARRRPATTGRRCMSPGRGT